MLEVVLTLFLMFVILSVSTGAKEKGIMAGVAVGAVIALEALFAGPVCGASMNPARSLAPAVVAASSNTCGCTCRPRSSGRCWPCSACRCVQQPAAAA